MIIKLKNNAVPAEQIIGVGNVEVQTRGNRFNFHVDVPGGRYPQVYGSHEEAVAARNAILEALSADGKVVDSTESADAARKGLEARRKAEDAKRQADLKKKAEKDKKAAADQN